MARCAVGVKLDVKESLSLRSISQIFSIIVLLNILDLVKRIWMFGAELLKFIRILPVFCRLTSGSKTSEAFWNSCGYGIWKWDSPTIQSPGIQTSWLWTSKALGVFQWIRTSSWWLGKLTVNRHCALTRGKLFDTDIGQETWSSGIQQLDLGSLAKKIDR